MRRFRKNRQSPKCDNILPNLFRPMKPPRRIKPPPIYVRPLSAAESDLQSAAQMAHEWGERPFDESRARANLSARAPSQVTLLAFRNGEAAGLLRGETVHPWGEAQPCAFAPLIWTRGVCEKGGQVAPPLREKAALALARRFLLWAREKEFASARAVFRAGMIPDSQALAEIGLRREFRICLRRAPLPGDPVSGRLRWFSTEAREAQGQEMNLPPEQMFPELFLEKRDLPPPVRRLETADEKAALAVVRESRRARGLPFSEPGFRGLFRGSVSRPDRCALATMKTAAEGGGLSGVLMGRAVAHPLADGCFSRVEALEWRGDGAKAARMAAWGLWREFVFWSARRLCRTMLMIPPEGKFGEEFARKCRLTPFGICHRADLESEADG